MGMGELAYAQKLRDTIYELVDRRVGQIRPKASLATVVTLDHPNNKCMVKFPGETDADAVPVKMYTLRPTAVGDVVRVEGDPGNRYIVDVISGSPTVVLKASNGTRYRLIVSTTGALSTSAI